MKLLGIWLVLVSKLQRSLVLLLCLVAPGCVQIGQREPVHQDRLIRTEEGESPAEGVFAETQISGTKLTLIATKSCDLTQVKVVDRTTTIESFNESPNTSWMIAGTGAVAIGLGASMMGGAVQTAPEHPTKDRNTGIALTAGGVAMVTAAVIDAIRASATTTSNEEVKLPGAKVKQGVACSDAPAGRLAVTGKLLDDRIVSLGSTDPMGRLTVDLNAAIPGYYLTPHEPMQIAVGDEVVGSVDLSGLVEHRAAQEFANLDLEPCVHPTKVYSCDHLNRFVGQYPESKEAREVTRVLRASEPLINALVDDEAWAEVTASDCGRTDHAEAQQQFVACEAARNYRDQFPSGKHAEEVSKLLDSAKARADKLHLAAQKAEKAEAAKEAGAEKAKCEGQCRVICSSRRFADFGSCFQGCVASQQCSQ